MRTHRVEGLISLTWKLFLSATDLWVSIHEISHFRQITRHSRKGIESDLWRFIQARDGTRTWILYLFILFLFQEVDTLRRLPGGFLWFTCFSPLFFSLLIMPVGFLWLPSSINLPLLNQVPLLFVGTLRKRCQDMEDQGITSHWVHLIDCCVMREVLGLFSWHVCPILSCS